MQSKWRQFLHQADEHAEFLRQGTRTGRPCGDEGFVKKIEKLNGRLLSRKKPGPKPKKRGRHAK